MEYTVTYNGSDTEKKSFTLNVYDLTGPVIDCTLGANNYAPAGGSFDLSTIAVSDNSGETISPEISVTLNGEFLRAGNVRHLRFGERFFGKRDQGGLPRVHFDGRGERDLCLQRVL